MLGKSIWDWGIAFVGVKSMLGKSDAGTEPWTELELFCSLVGIISPSSEIRIALFCWMFGWTFFRMFIPLGCCWTCWGFYIFGMPFSSKKSALSYGTASACYVHSACTCGRRDILSIRIAIQEVVKFLTTPFEVTCHATFFTFGILGSALGFMFLIVWLSAAVTQPCRTIILFARSRRSIIILSGLGFLSS